MAIAGLDGIFTGNPNPAPERRYLWPIANGYYLLFLIVEDKLATGAIASIPGLGNILYVQACPSPVHSNSQDFPFFRING